MDAGVASATNPEFTGRRNCTTIFLAVGGGENAMLASQSARILSVWMAHKSALTVTIVFHQVLHSTHFSMKF